MYYPHEPKWERTKLKVFLGVGGDESIALGAYEPRDGPETRLH